MCGITGIYHFDLDRKVNEVLLKRMTDTLSHRGPDGAGYYIHNNIGLGHRRLTIIDLETGDQPQFSEDKSIAIIFNGEIYNYIELKKELEAVGYKFRTNSDTEVIIQAYRNWGLECQNKFNGMWAFALWDDREKRLFISRDRLGEKPLYYGSFDGSILFGSEIKSLLAYGCEASANLELTQLYLSLGYIPAPYSYYKNISKLRQGHYLIIKDNLVKETKYWDVPELNEEAMLKDEKEVYRKFEELFYDSVKIRMRSDVPFGAFLSGGLDSASVVAVMSEISKEPVQTFTIGFQEKEFDERNLAKDVAMKFNTKHSEFMVELDRFEESLDRIVHHYDEPFGDSSAIPTGYVSKIATRHVKMVLTGDGGDEVLSGYNSYQIEKFADRYQTFPGVLQRALPRLISPVKSMFSGSLRYKLNRIERILDYSQQSYESRLIVKSSWCDPFEIGKMTAGLGNQIELADFIDHFYSHYKASDPFYKLMLFQHKVLLPDDFLVKVDRMSMANSLETRVPFLDYRLVEFMLTVSKNVKMRGYTRKSVLRNTIGEKLPPSVMAGSKKGFSVPIREWFKDKAFDQKLESLFKDDFGLDQSLIQHVVMDNKFGKRDLGNFIWMLFVLKSWNQKSRVY